MTLFHLIQLLFQLIDFSLNSILPVARVGLSNNVFFLVSPQVGRLSFGRVDELTWSPFRFLVVHTIGLYNINA